MKRFGTIIVAMTICFTAKANVKEQLSNLGINEYNCWVTIKPNSMQFSYGYQVFAENEKDAVRSLLNKIDATFGGGSNLYAIVDEYSPKSRTQVESLSCRKNNDANSPEELPTTEFKAAMKAINNQCTTCHVHAIWKNFTAKDFINQGLAVPKSPEESSIYYRNTNANVGPGPKNMPIQGLPKLKDSELNDILVWINSL
jgi:hypothetical protein